YEVLHVQAPMQCGESLVGHILEEGHVDEVDMEVQNIEFVGTGTNFVHQCKMRGEIGFARCPVESNSLITDWDQLRLGLRLYGRKEGDVMPEVDQCIGEISDDAFRAAIEAWWHGFIERGNLGDFHQNTREGVKIDFGNSTPNVMRMFRTCEKVEAQFVEANGLVE